MNSLSQQPLSFDIVLKVAERCNLACPYCYYFFQEYDGNANAPLITAEVEEELPRFLLRSVEQLNLQRLNIVLHGGEPLLLKKRRFDALCTRLRRELDGKTELTFGIQTNGVLIDDEWIEIFARHGIRPGVSIDGLKSTHDRLRPDHRGRGSYDAAVRGLRLVQEAVNAGRLDRAGALCVVHVGDETEKLLEHLIFELDIHSPSLNFPRGGWDNADVVAWNEGVESHRKIVRYWIDNLVFPQFHFVRGITDVFFSLYSELGAANTDVRASSRHYIATISSEGVLLPDDNIIGLDTRFGDSGLKIFGTSLRDFVESPLWNELETALDNVPGECRECEWYRSCRGGDLFNRYSRQQGFAAKSVLCDTIKMIHEELSAFMIRRGIVSVEDLATRLGTVPTATAAKVREALLQKPLALEPQPAIA